MTSEEYKIQFETIRCKRGKEPENWWISHDDDYNSRKSEWIADVIIRYPEHYKRELEYKKELYKITQERLKSIKHTISKGDTVFVSNVVWCNNYSYLRDEELGRNQEVPIKITGNNPSVAPNGFIYYQVQYKDGHFTIYEHEIINK